MPAMVFQKILAGILGILIIWVMVPHVKKGEFISPNPISPDDWVPAYTRSEYQRSLATPPEGYGFRRFDGWNNPPLGGRPVSTEDFQLQY